MNYFNYTQSYSPGTWTCCESCKTSVLRDLENSTFVNRSPHICIKGHGVEVIFRTIAISTVPLLDSELQMTVEERS